MHKIRAIILIFERLRSDQNKRKTIEIRKYKTIILFFENSREELEENEKK